MRDDRLVKLILSLLEPGDQIRLADKFSDVEKVEGEFIYDSLGREIHYSCIRGYMLHGEEFLLELDKDAYVDDESEDIFKDSEDPEDPKDPNE